MVLTESELNELNYKMNVILEYLKNNNGHNYKLYNHACPDTDEPDSDIVEYAQDVKDIINSQFNDEDTELPF